METLTEPGAGVAADELAAIETAVREAEPAYLADLERLVNTDCGSYTPAGVDRIGEFVAAFLDGTGARVERRPGHARRAAPPADRPHGHGLRRGDRRGPPVRSRRRRDRPRARRDRHEVG